MLDIRRLKKCQNNINNDYKMIENITMIIRSIRLKTFKNRKDCEIKRN